MKFSANVVSTANKLRDRIQQDRNLPTVDHGESVAILIWWSFLLDHSRCEGIPIEELARAQLDAFIVHARTHFAMIRPGDH